MQDDQGKPTPLTNESIEKPAVISTVDSVGVASPVVPSKKRRWLKISIGLILILLIGGVITFFLLRADEPMTGDQNKTTEQQAAQAVSPENFSEELSGYVDEILSTNPAYARDDIRVDGASRVVFYSVAINNYAEVNGEPDWSGELARSVNDTSAAGEDIFAEFERVLRAANFRDYTGKVFNQYDYQIALQRNGMVCVIGDYSGKIYYDCAEEAGVETAAQRVKPLYDAYLLAYPDIGGAAIISVGEAEENAKYPDYETISARTLYDGGSAALSFYRVDDSNWVFGYGGHEAPLCDRFADSPDAQKAYYDTGCYVSVENPKTTTVELYYAL